VGAALFVWGSLIRLEGTLLVAVEGALLALPLLPRTSRPRLREASVAAGAAVLAAVALHAIPAAPADWRRFAEYDRYRLSVAEYRPAPVTPAALAELRRETGWSANDFALFRGWFFADPDRYGIARVRRAEAVLDLRQPIDWRGTGEAVGMFVANVRWVLLLLAAFAIASGARLRFLLYLSFAVAVVVLLVGALSLHLKYPLPRITGSMLLLAATMLLFGSRSWGRPVKPWIAILAMLLGLYVAAPSLPALHRKSDASIAGAAAAERDVARLRSGAALTVFHANAFPYEDYWRPLHARRDAPAFLPLGVYAQSPPVQQFLRRKGWTDLPRALCTEPSLQLVTFPQFPPMLETAVREHQHAAVRYEPVFQGERVTAWKCRR